ncbi:MAG: GDSL-like Lipase/Acylhydrolase [Actinobacteria bacterium ADurb.Bin346]|nr:MAG: GDSL-like Lipase/Acylhydrolase [Actinobacteria bacterium ADurb.Bin346]
MTKKKKLWIIVSSAAMFLLAAASAALYIYYFYYNKPNFTKDSSNSIIAAKAGSLTPGEEQEYKINFFNAGSTEVLNLKISTAIPSNTKYLSSSPQAEIDSASGKLIFSVGSLAKNTAGSVSFKVRVDSPLDNGTEIKTAEVQFTYTARGKSHDFNIAGAVVSRVSSSPDLSGFKIKISDLNGADISIGDKVEFIISLANSGNMNAQNIRVINIVPDKFILDKKSIKPGAQKNEINNNNKEIIIWELNELKAGEKQNLSFTATAGNDFNHLEKFTDTASVEYGGSKVNEASASGKVLGFPDFGRSSNSVTDADGGSVWAGDILKYDINVKNTGLRAGKDFKLICPIPESTTYVKGSENNKDTASYDAGSNTLSWNIENLEVSGEMNFEFSVKINSSLVKGGRIDSGFYIEGDSQNVRVEPASINVRSFIFQTVVCMGDSLITYTNWPANLDYLLESNYPHAEFRTIGSGVPQQMAYQGVRRFDSTVAVYKPGIIVIGYGTNDAGSGTQLFADGIAELIQKVKAIGATPIVHSIGYIDTGINPAKKGYLDYNDVLQKVCSANGVTYVDIYGPMSQDPERYVSSDGMHWTSDGGALVASLVFNAVRNCLDSEGNRK